MTVKDTALAAARAAGAIQKRLYGTLLNVDQATRHDVKLEADRLCEQAIVEAIRRDWPGHAILTEEAGTLGGDGDCWWLIDPLDGTVNFFYGIPYFCTSVACYRRPAACGTAAGLAPDPGEGARSSRATLTLPSPCKGEGSETPLPLREGAGGGSEPLPAPSLQDRGPYSAAAPRGAAFPRGLESLGEPLVGVVYAPPTDELFVAEAGGGATLNGTPIRPSGVADLAEAMVGTGFGARPGAVEHFVGQIGRLAPRVRKVRSLGSAAYDLCNVACGRLSAFYEQRLRTWDIAAAGVVLRAAGAVLDAIETAEAEWNTVAAAPGLYPAFRDLVRGT